MMHGFQTKEEAVEAWNTWKGRYLEIDPATFCKNNPCNSCGLVVDGYGKYSPLPKKEMVGGSEMLIDGSFTVPWPRLTPGQKKSGEQLFEGKDFLEFTFSLCARWCALFPSVIEYRQAIVELLRQNDRDNEILNRQLEEWNKYLTQNGFTPFEENDLRGVNLSGLRLEGEPYQGVWLRNVDLSFSELSLVQLRGVNLYGARLKAVSSIYANFSFSVCSSADFSRSFISNGHFEGADISNANFTESMCHLCCFDGAILHSTDFSCAQCTQISLKPLTYSYQGIQKKRETALCNIKCDNTDFTGVSTEGIDWRGSQTLKAMIDDQNRAISKTGKETLWNRFVSLCVVCNDMLQFAEYKYKG
ncbi:MAG: pentapeptide repeat-containing protein [Desulfobacterales bacterium]|nr:pentapeptide repeat-containing protein [Desulfobacterales bacterium]